MKIPPKIVRDQLVNVPDLTRDTSDGFDVVDAPGQDENGGVILRRTQAIRRTGESATPVLEAFKEFLELERRKARVRTMAVAAFSLLVIIIMCGAGFFVSVSVLNQMKAEVNGVQKDLVRFQTEAAGMREAANKAVSKIDEQSDKVTTLMKESSKREQEEAARLKGHVAGQKEDIETLKKLVDTIARENSGLKKDLGSLKTELPAIATSVDAALKEIAQEKMRAPVPAPGTAPEIPAELPADLKDPGSSLTLSIRPEGSDELIPWRLAIPE